MRQACKRMRGRSRNSSGDVKAGSARRLPRLIYSRIGLNEDGEMLTPGADISDLHTDIGADLLLDPKVVVIRVRCLEVCTPPEQNQKNRRK